MLFLTNLYLLLGTVVKWLNRRTCDGTVERVGSVATKLGNGECRAERDKCAEWGDCETCITDLRQPQPVSLHWRKRLSQFFPESRQRVWWTEARHSALKLKQRGNEAVWDVWRGSRPLTLTRRDRIITIVDIYVSLYVGLVGSIKLVTIWALIAFFMQLLCEAYCKYKGSPLHASHVNSNSACCLFP